MPSRKYSSQAGGCDSSTPGNKKAAGITCSFFVILNDADYIVGLRRGCSIDCNTNVRTGTTFSFSWTGQIFEGLDLVFHGWIFFKGLDMASQDFGQLVYSDWICYTKIASLAPVTNSTALHCRVEENE